MYIGMFVQYANSDNCMMELRYAALTLKKPIVFVVVGTGSEWKDTEVSFDERIEQLIYGD
jgi:hypothetical protein